MLRVSQTILALIASLILPCAQAAPVIISLEYEPVLSGPAGPINTTVPAGIAVSGQLVIDDSVFAAATGPFVDLAQADPELVSLQITGSGFGFDDPGALSSFTFNTNDFADIALSVLATIDLNANLVGQPTGIGGPGGGPASFDLNYATFNGFPLSPVDQAFGVSAGSAVSFPPGFGFDTGPGLIPFFTNPENNPDGSGFNDIELIQFELTGAFATVIPVPAAVWLFGSALGLLGWLRRSRTITQG